MISFTAKLPNPSSKVDVVKGPCLCVQFASPMPMQQTLEIPIDSGIGLSITIDKLRVFINKTLSTESLINQLLIKRACLSISIDSR